MPEFLISKFEMKFIFVTGGVVSSLGKGLTAAEVVAHPRRILSPMRRVGDRYEPATYAEAIAGIAARSHR